MRNANQLVVALKMYSPVPREQCALPPTRAILIVAPFLCGGLFVGGGRRGGFGFGFGMTGFTCEGLLRTSGGGEARSGEFVTGGGFGWWGYEGFLGGGGNGLVTSGGRTIGGSGGDRLGEG